MVTLLLDSAQLEVVLSPLERALSFRSASLRVDRSRIVKVQLTDDPWTWLRGVAGPGTHVRGVVAMGTWRSAGGTDFVVVRRRRPAVVIDLVPESADGTESDGVGDFDRLLLSTRHGVALLQALQLETDSEPVEVSEIVTGAVPTSAPPRRPRRAPRPVPAT